MPAPFPGMNPFLERANVWHDFYKRFLILGAGVIGAQVRPNFIVRIDEDISICEVLDEPSPSVGQADQENAPNRVQIPITDVVRDTFLEIRDLDSMEVVTVLELLSPLSKRDGPDRRHYLSRRRRVLASPAHLVELDLLRVGEPMPSEDRPECSYSVMVSRAEARPRAGFWPIGLREPLPTIPIPLRAPHPDATLDLQALLHRVYDEAGYEYYIYDGTPEPPLAPEDDAWARQFVPAAR